jgi:hypothetical protein
MERHEISEKRFISIRGERGAKRSRYSRTCLRSWRNNLNAWIHSFTVSHFLAHKHRE